MANEQAWPSAEIDAGKLIDVAEWVGDMIDGLYAGLHAAALACRDSGSDDLASYALTPTILYGLDAATAALTNLGLDYVPARRRHQLKGAQAAILRS